MTEKERLARLKELMKILGYQRCEFCGQHCIGVACIEHKDLVR